MASVRFIPTKIHGVLDYTVGALMSSSPLFLNGIKKAVKAEERQGKVKFKPEELIPYAMGAFSGLYSLLTNYELGVAKKIPMKVHLILDAIGGAFLAASPWLFGFNKKVWIPFVAVGAFEIGAAAFTQLDSSSVKENFDV
jgi:hypothetical protein